MKLLCSECKKGGFQLRSWNSNSLQLLAKFSHDGTIVEHDCKLEKVLGYKYSPSYDTLHISESNLDPTADTRRSILSQISKVFDPLGFCLPVTVKGKSFNERTLVI